MSKVLYTLLELRYLWKQKGNKNYKLKDILMKGDFADRLIFEDVTNHRLVSGKIVYSSNEGENYHWPKLKHENLAPLIDIVNLNEHQSVFISLPVGQSLSEIIHDEQFMINPNCIDRKKAYAEDILWGLDYLHKRRLCLLNLSDKNISIQMLSDKAVIFDFSDLKCAELVKKNQMYPKDFYHAPELYCHVSEEFDALCAEIWACGEMFLSLFTNHLKLIKPTGEKVCNALEMVEVLDAKLLTLANPSVFISKAFVFDFKIFLCLFLQIEPEYRITARNAAISTFLNRTNQRKNEEVNRLWELYDNQELKQSDLHHSFKERSDGRALGELEQTSLQSKLEDKETNNFNSTPIEKGTKVPFWGKTNTIANIQEIGSIQENKIGQKGANSMKYVNSSSRLQKWKSLSTVIAENSEIDLSISQFGRSTALDKLFNKLACDENGKKQVVRRGRNSMFSSSCDKYMLNKEVQTDISVSSLERIHSITILEQFREMIRGQNIQMIRFKNQKSSSDSNLHNHINLGKHYSLSSQTNDVFEYLIKYVENFGNEQARPNSCYIKQNSCGRSKSLSFSSECFIPSELKEKEHIEKCYKIFNTDGHVPQSPKNQNFSSHQEPEKSSFSTSQLNQMVENNSIEFLQTDYTNSCIGDSFATNFAHFKRISQQSNYFKDSNENLNEENYARNKNYQRINTNIFSDHIDEEKTECYLSINNISQSNLQFVSETLNVNEIDANTKARSYLDNHELAHHFSNGEVVKLSSLKEPKNNDAKETAFNASYCAFDNTDCSSVRKKCFGKFKDGKKKRKLHKIWLPSWWRKKFRKIRKKKRARVEETDCLTEPANKTDF